MTIGSTVGPDISRTTRTTPPDYAERVYAGVLGKIVGVYLGRPIESWTYEQISDAFGEIGHYLPGRDGAPLVVTDDDITGTFTFLRALPDHGNSLDLTPRLIGQTWLNYTIERRTIFWWGGFGNSTEHTAYLRLKHGIPAPESGSIARNGKVVAEQIGSQIFIDGWAMVAPGDPELAADLARRAGSVSHDGEAIYGAQVIAAMEAQAFIEADLNRLIDTAVALIPRDSTIYRLIDDIRSWHAADPDWRTTRQRIADRYGYDRYLGNCHMVPNHALIILGLLYGDDDFRQTLKIVNTAGWDTDCNSGNAGCLLGIKNGLAAFEGTGVDWRGPVADRLYLSTADGGRAITDAAIETYHIVNLGRALAGETPLSPKGGARFHFELSGSVQGFQADPTGAPVTIENVEGHSAVGNRGLAIHYRHRDATPSRITAATFIPPEAKDLKGYRLLASPTIYPGQTIRARLEADQRNATASVCRLVLRAYGADDELFDVHGPRLTLAAGTDGELRWRIPDMGGSPFFAVGLDVGSASGAPGEGTVYLDFLTWDGEPDVTLARPGGGGDLWRRAWVDAVDQFEGRWQEPYRIIQNEGTGLISQGTAEWADYEVSAPITVHLATAGGIGARVQGLRRYYALLLGEGGVARLVKARDETATLAEAPFAWEPEVAYTLSLRVEGSRIEAAIDGQILFAVDDGTRPLTAGGVALICTEGCVSSQAVRISPLR